MSHKQEIKFVKKLKRESKAPFPTTSTSLWLANIVNNDGGEPVIDFSKYIYVHRDDVGLITGISISKNMMSSDETLRSQYITGERMYSILTKYLDEIKDFCELWADEFESYFLLKPHDYFESVGDRWCAIAQLSNSN